MPLTRTSWCSVVPFAVSTALVTTAVVALAVPGKSVRWKQCFLLCPDFSSHWLFVPGVCCVNCEICCKCGAPCLFPCCCLGIALDCDQCSCCNAQLQCCCVSVQGSFPCSEDVPAAVTLLGLTLYPCSSAGCCVSVKNVNMSR
jgi:hypothetical protein